MRWGMAAWGLRETPLTEQLALARTLGLDELELGIANAPGDVLQADAGEAETVRQAFARYGMTPGCAATGNDFTLADEADSRESLSRTGRAMRKAHELGIRFMRVFAGFIPAAELTPSRREFLCRCLAAVTGYGVTPALETHGGVRGAGQGVLHAPSITTDRKCLDGILERIPELMLCFDPANLCAVNEDPVDFYRQYRDRIATMHLKDFVRNPDGSLRPGACGEGMVPWEPLLAEIRRFEGPALIEYEVTADVACGMRRSLAFLRRLDA